MMLTDREKVFGVEGDTDYYWCMHCERGYRRGQCRRVVQKHRKGSWAYRAFGPETVYENCPYDDCDGSTVTDAWRWEKLRAEAHPEWPAEPVWGVGYPLYPEGNQGGH